jgi:hypothetical protein
VLPGFTQAEPGGVPPVGGAPVPLPGGKPDVPVGGVAPGVLGVLVVGTAGAGAALLPDPTSPVHAPNTSADSKVHEARAVLDWLMQSDARSRRRRTTTLLNVRPRRISDSHPALQRAQRKMLAEMQIDTSQGRFFDFRENASPQRESTVPA